MMDRQMTHVLETENGEQEGLEPRGGWMGLCTLWGSLENFRILFLSVSSLTLALSHL